MGKMNELHRQKQEETLDEIFDELFSGEETIEIPKVDPAEFMNEIVTGWANCLKIGEMHGTK